jgi:hypothetical protein
MKSDYGKKVSKKKPERKVKKIHSTYKEFEDQTDQDKN